MHRPFRAEDAAGIIRNAAPAQELVDQAVLRQQPHPGIDTDQKRRPEGQHDQHQQQGAPLRARPRDGVGHGIAEEQRDQSRGRRDAQRRQPGRDVEIVGEQQGEVLEAEAQLDRRRDVGRIGAERDGQDQSEWQQEENCEPQERKRDGVAHGLGAHSLRRCPASADQPSHTLWPRAKEAGCVRSMLVVETTNVPLPSVTMR